MTKDEEKIKVLELICSQIEPGDDILEGWLLVDDFERQGMNYYSGKIMMRKLYEEGILSFYENSVSPENDEPSISLVTSPGNVESYLESLKYGKGNKVDELSFDTDKGMLKVNDAEIKISIRREKTNGHYILEYIFENDEGLRARSYYAEINDKYFKGEEKDPKTFYDACVSINNKVMREAGIPNFLEFSAQKDGSVRINPDYIHE